MNDELGPQTEEEATKESQLVTELEMIVGAFESAQFLDDWDFARATLETTLDLVWRLYHAGDPGKAITCPITPRSDWFEDWVGVEALIW